MNKSFKIMEQNVVIINLQQSHALCSFVLLTQGRSFIAMQKAFFKAAACLLEES